MKRLPSEEGRPLREWLSLGAAPTFAIMALHCGLQDGCMPGMVPMYALMSLFHVNPWLRLQGQWRSAAM